MVFVYLDDILLVGQTQCQVQSHLKILLDTLKKSGFIINLAKSILTPTQNINHLGFNLDLQSGHLKVPKEKLKGMRKELGKLVTHTHMSSRKMAAILGVVRSCLPALPILKAFTDTFVQFVNKNIKLGWDSVHIIPKELKDQLLDLKSLLLSWVGKPFIQKATTHLHSDSSQLAWAGVNLTDGRQIQEFWRDRSSMHINIKELEAAISTVKSFAKERETVLLSVDNKVAFHYLLGGGKLPHLNKIIRPFLTWCQERLINLQVEWVPSQEMLADKLSRWTMDRGDYTLNNTLFQAILTHFQSQICPTVDFFASPGNAKLPQFVSRWPHFQAIATDALNCPLHQFHHIYANPPWTLIAKWLHRLRENPHLLCLMVCPYWVSAPWWPLLTKLACTKTKALIIQPFQGMFTNCQDKLMPPPKWPLISVLLSGQF